MKWRAWIRVYNGAVQDVFNRSDLTDEAWEKQIKKDKDGHKSSFGGHWWAVEVEEEVV